jgi:tripartite ATP-independent transporter DctM subunit
VDPLTLGLIGIFCMIVLLMVRVPIGFSMALVGFLGFSLLSTFPAGFSMLAMVTYKTAASYTLTVIPLFILMGQFANHSRMGFDLYQTAYRWLGFLPGGLAMASIGACACFAAISGSSMATAATMGMVALPEMKRFQYDDALATGCVAAGGTLGILIPPSTVMIIYGILTEQSIGTLFIAGIIPGLILSGLFMVAIYVVTKRNPTLGPPGPRFSLKEKIYSLKDTWGVITLFLLIIGGLYAGWFTATEAAGMGAFGAFVIILIKRRLTRQTLTDALLETTLTTGMIFTILIGANIFGYFLTVSQMTDQLSTWVAGLDISRYAVMLLICLVYIILGCLMDGLAIMILTLPIVYPLVMGLGFDPIWFGVMMTLLLEMGLITPPVGLNVFVISGIARDVPMYTIFRGIWPFFVAMVICMFLLIVFPQIALFLPATMAKW